MLLSGVSGELKNASEESEIISLLDGSTGKESFMHEALTNPQFGVLSGGSPTLTDSNGIPWSGAYVNANGDPTVDMRSNMAAESRAKFVYESLLKFTDDPYVRETLRFLMTREVAHYQMFEAALETIQPNFPPGILQSDPHYSNTYYNLSKGEEVRGPWNQGKSTQLGEEWQYVEDPVQEVRKTNGLLNKEIEGTERTMESVKSTDEKLAKERSEQINNATPTKENQWSEYYDA